MIDDTHYNGRGNSWQCLARFKTVCRLPHVFLALALVPTWQDVIECLLDRVSQNVHARQKA